MARTPIYFFGLLFFLSHPLFADDISLGNPDFGGNGCPKGSVSAILSPDGSELSILFDAYTVEASGSKKVDQKHCNLNIPLHIPSGISVAITKMDYRGFSSVPEGANAELEVDSFFTGIAAHGPKHKAKLKAKTHGNFFLSNQLATPAVIWTPCGKDLNLKILSSLKATTNSSGEQTLAALDTLDLAAGLDYSFQMRSCPENGPKKPPLPHGPRPRGF